MSYYQQHAFFCCNQREGGEICCNDHGADTLRAYAKRRIDELDLKGKGKVRINMSGCLGRCKEGPIIVVYPNETWYTYSSQEDIDAIIDEHLVKGNVVKHLKI